MSVLAVLPRTAAVYDRRLTIGGVALADVAAEFGTPAFVADELGLRETARAYLAAFAARHAETDGGLGIAYRPGDRAPSIEDYAQATVDALHTFLDPGARLIVEPGRSVVGRSMVTLYEVVTVKRGRLTHVAVNDCESGDVLAHAVELATPEVGDLLVMPVTGAYCYSLQNNYNGARKPPVVLCRDGEARLVVRRETMNDLLARDVL